MASWLVIGAVRSASTPSVVSLCFLWAVITIRVSYSIDARCQLANPRGRLTVNAGAFGEIWRFVLRHVAREANCRGGGGFLLTERGNRRGGGGPRPRPRK